jgi:hypothetical protein
VCVVTEAIQHTAWNFKAGPCANSSPHRRYRYVFSHPHGRRFYGVFAVVAVRRGATAKVVLVKGSPLACDRQQRRLLFADPSSVPLKLICEP